MKKLASIATVGGSVFLAASAHAVTSIRVTVETTGTVGLAPGLAVFSDGSFDTFNPGEASSDALEVLAETGSPLDFDLTGFSGGAVLGPGLGAGSPPIFAQDTMNSTVFQVQDGFGSFNFASMLLPSNDWFIGNGTAFDVSGLLNGAIGQELSFNFATVWDAGTELEDFMFAPGNGLIGVTTMGTDARDAGADQVDGVVTAFDGTNPFSLFLNPSEGFDPTAFDFTGGDIATVTLTVVPEPSTTLLGALGALGLLARRKRA